MNTANLHLSPPHQNHVQLFCREIPFQTRQFFRFYRRRRLKPITRRRVTLCCNASLWDLSQNLFSQFSSPNSLDILAPVIGFASGLTLYLSKFKPDRSAAEIGEWILFTSPTPFNRFVLLRCPSISFEGSELLEDVNEKLVEQDRHFVRLNSGRIRAGGGEGVGFEKVKYQRVCVNTEDGGVISIDWPANLDLKEEHGFDTTFLLVPGTPEGSMDKNVRSFVCEALGRGFFPVVMNPRGCAGSPLTTARLFTAADSDDICTAIQFINKARPWTTLMAVGWGYGANMLTKYLAEAGETTPLTAATCINNPFDLEEATRCSPYHSVLDQKLISGLVDILQSNKELFQGRAKGFDVEKALVAKSVRDFEKSISMVSYGFDEIENFYLKSSTQAVVGNVKIPVLFIQNDDGTVPLFSIPRSLIAENPFTSLLLCSCVSSNITSNGKDAASWFQNLTIEWLAAVELGLLKGRHPLLKDVDVTINPANVEGRVSDKDADKLLDNNARMLISRSRVDSNRNLELQDRVQEVENDALEHMNSVNGKLANEEVASPEDDERGQVLQTTEMVMNILDATMPGTLSKEEKNKVLNAVSQGETLTKALQDAVPEEVRGKLTTAVSGILHSQRANFSKISNAYLGKSTIQEKPRAVSSADDLPKDPPPSNQIKTVDDGSDVNQFLSNKSNAGVEPELQPTEASQKSGDSGQPQTMNSQQGDCSDDVRKGTNESGNNHDHDSDANVREKAPLHSGSSEKREEASTKPSLTSHAERAGGADDTADDVPKMEQNDTISQPEMSKETNAQKNEDKIIDNPTDKSKVASSNTTEETPPPEGSSSESQPMERESSDNQKENKTILPILDQNTPADSNSPTFSVSQAFDAFTGMDDSTQVAVNSVFGVLEDMITQYEDGKEDEDKTKDTNKIVDESVDSSSKQQYITNDLPVNGEEINENDLRKQFDEEYKFNENIVSSKDAANTDWVEDNDEKPAESPILFSANGTTGTQTGNVSDCRSKEGESKEQLDGGKFLGERMDGHISNVPLYVTPNLYRDYQQNETFNSYLLSKVPSTKPLDLDTTTALFLDYFPEEGQWKLLDQPGNIAQCSADFITHKGVDRTNQAVSPVTVSNTDKYIEPQYVVLDTEQNQEPVGEYDVAENLSENVENCDERLRKLMQFVKVVILDALRVEVGRRPSADDMKKMEPNLARDMEEVAGAVSLAVGRIRDDTWSLQDKEYSIRGNSEKVGTLDGELMIRAISSAVKGTSYLRRVLPIGVIVGSSLAALRKYFDMASRHDKDIPSIDQQKKTGLKNKNKAGIKDMDLKSSKAADQMNVSNGKNDAKRGEMEVKNVNNDSVMFGAVTAALGASALLVQQQNSYKSEDFAESTSKDRAIHQKAAAKLDEAMPEKNQNNIVASLAEKAMSVAGPVVPTRDGGVDQERLVAMLSDLGQKGGMLRLVGKIALLWGGIRGAMSLTDKLISFLRIAERPLHLRILGFVGMVLVLWSPVVVPLLPTIFQCWTSNNPSRFCEFVCIIGLYAAVMILVMIWGKRIRGYEDPLKQYGLDFTTLSKIQSFLWSLVGGVVLVLSIQTLNTLLGCASFSWPVRHPSLSQNAVACVKAYGKIIVLAGRGIITAIGVVLAEELLFRSWLPEEIAPDLGYHQGIIISGLAFSLLQRSAWAIPGLWLLSLALSGLRQRSQGSLAIPIGLRAGIMASSFVLQEGGFLTYNRTFPLWVTGTHPIQPYSGVVGLAFSLLLATIFYLRELLRKKHFAE